MSDQSEIYRCVRASFEISPRDHPELGPLLLVPPLLGTEFSILELLPLSPLMVLSLISSNRFDGGLGS